MAHSQSAAVPPATLIAQQRLIVALDFANPEDARSLVKQLGETVNFYKIGLELAMNGGLDLVRELKQEGANVFLDMKLLDIANTVERATANAARCGADFLTIHASDIKTMSAAASGAADSGLKILGVTVMTNLDSQDLAQQGISESPSALVVRRAKLAREAGCHGVIASGQEARSVRAACGDDCLIVTPGIRMADDAVDDQKRTATPEAAIQDGADYLVVGRPITKAANPAAAAASFVARIAGAA